MTAIDIRPVEPGMLDTLVLLEQQTYTETFAHNYRPEDLAIFLQEKKSPAVLLSELQQPGALYYIIYHQAVAAGFIKLNLNKQPDDAVHTVLPTPVMELEKIYVLQAFQGHKLGKALIQQAYAVAREHGIKSIWLGVWEHNTRALRFYQQEGFTHFSEHTFKVGSQDDTDWLMRKELF
ncbi:GNAT family N-acetyltransferase [Chitinophaga agrisoli]|uniref:GNAT family N-acetyltransferase n=1 Tax=Chitinophaga agrisoli TaxID=2607653 RepID=A0A5B2W010_9BACT|nr:GNAT family N-acetyltransferase [Chitinophaga agrisoli]KAA2244655.1 GNAT family N-acetyltransferase [Chitinophaga agrisoli]